MLVPEHCCEEVKNLIKILVYIDLVHQLSVNKAQTCNVFSPAPLHLHSA